MTDRDKILSKTNGGFDVFVHYMGEVCSQKLFCNPFRSSDSNPSCHVYFNKKHNRFFLKDFGDNDWCCDCFGLVARLIGLNERTDFTEILRTIDKELCLNVLDGTPFNNYSVMPKANHIKPPKDSRLVSFIPKFRNFNRFELAYWQSYGITINLLDKYQAKCLSSCTFVRTDGSQFNIYGTKEVPMFGYMFNSGTGIKVYRPGAQTGRFLYAGNLPNPYVYGLEHIVGYQGQYPFLNEGDFMKSVLFITGGEKDVLSLASRGFNAICFNSESAKIPDVLMTQFLDDFSYVVFLYDVDEAGKRDAALRIAECQSIKHVCSHVYHDPVINVQLPLPGTKQAKDVSDFFRLGHTAIELRQLVLSSISSNH